MTYDPTVVMTAIEAEGRATTRMPILFRIDDGQLVRVGELTCQHPGDIYDDISFKMSMGSLGITDKTEALGLTMESYTPLTAEELKEQLPEWYELMKRIHAEKFQEITLEDMVPVVLTLYLCDTYGSLSKSPRELIHDGRNCVLVDRSGKNYAMFRIEDGRIINFGEGEPVTDEAFNHFKGMQFNINVKNVGLGIAHLLHQAMA